MKHGRLRRIGIGVFAVLVIAGAICATFCVGTPRPIIPHLFSGGFDGWLILGPQAILMDHAIHSGELPLWNPLTLCGMPALANAVSGVFYPPNLLRSALTFNPTPYKTHLGLLILTFIHMLLAGTGAFALARTHRVSVSGATVAAFCFVLSAVFLRWAVETWQSVAVVAWLPWLLLLTRKGLIAQTARAALAYGLIIGLILGACLCSLYPQFFIHLCVATATYGLLFRLLFREECSTPQPARSRWLLRVGLVLVLPFVLAPLVAAIHLVPGFEFAQKVGRAHGAAPIEGQARYLDRSPLKVLEHLVVYPGSFGIEARRAAGVGVLILAAASVTFVRRRDWLLWALAFLVLLDCSLGAPFPVASLVDAVAPFPMRFPSRILIFTCLPLGILAGMGVDAATARLDRPWKNGLRAALLGVHAAVLVSLLAYWTTHSTWLPVSKLAIIAPIGVALVVVAAPWLRAPAFWRAALPVLFLLETGAWNREYLRYLHSCIHIEELGGTVEDMDRPRPMWADNLRGTDSFPNLRARDLEPAINGVDAMLLERVRQVLCAPSSEQHYSHWVHDAEVTEKNHRGNLFLKRAFWLAKEYVPGPLPGKDALFPPTTTAFLLDPPELTVPTVARDTVPASAVSAEARNVPLPEPVPRKEEGSEVYDIRFPDPGETHKHGALALTLLTTEPAVLRTRFHTATTRRTERGKRYDLAPNDEPVTIEIPLPAGPLGKVVVTVEGDKPDTVRILEAILLVDEADENDRIAILGRTANRVRLDVGPLDGPRILVFLDAAFPGWQAWVDGDSVPIFVAQDAFKAIELGSGAHQVTFEFRPVSFRVGAAVSGTTCILLAAALAYLAATRKPSASE